MITLLADDLSGAQEAFAAAADLPETSTTAAGLLLLDADAVPAHGPEVLAVDLDARRLEPGAAAAALRRGLARLSRSRRRDGPLVVKIDSLLRGPVAALLGALVETAPVVLCPAVPALGRTVEGGRPLVQGTPLAQTGLWAVEPCAPPSAVGDLAPHLDPETIALEEVRGHELPERLAAAVGRTRLVVADAATDADCTAIARAASPLGVVLVGAAGLARAAGSLQRAGSPATAPSDGSRTGAASAVRSAPVAVVVGSAAGTARDQVRELADQGVPVLSWRPGVELAPPAGPEADVVLVLDAPFDPDRADQLNAEFSDAVAAAVPGHHLVLTGGQTARAVLDRLGVARLHPLSQPHHGAVLAAAGDGRLVATRPGSFGGRDSLLTLRTALRAAVPADPRAARRRAQTPFTRGPAA